MNYKVIFPIYNAEPFLELLINTLLNKNKLNIDSCLFIDSSSIDNSVKILNANKIPVQRIKKGDFDHGATRQFATELVDADIYVFMTQDALPADKDAIGNLLKAFDDPNVGCAYGRQLPHKDANILASHARAFNYPEESYVRSYEDRKQYGIKTCFNSNSFAAYRKTALQDVGGFPSKNILGEDMFVAARMLQDNWKVAYCADAQVYHSHNYTLMQEFKRYFDIGVFHHEQSWILKDFSSPEDEGMKYVKSELNYCWKGKHYLVIIRSYFTILLKFIGYKLGKNYTFLPQSLRPKLSMCSFYWIKK